MKDFKMGHQKNSVGRRRAFGQHFLKDQALCQRIAHRAIDLAVETGCDRLLEIGPGLGALTHPLVETLQNQMPKIELTLVEKDRLLFDKWPEHWHGICSDFLDLKDSDWLGQSPLVVVSNLPYSSGTAILNRLAPHVKMITGMVLMFQAEVAKRLAAPPSGSHRGSLSVWIQNNWDVVSFEKVPPSAFSPPPKVNSEVVILTPRKTSWVDVGTEPHERAVWDSFLKTCFAHRRKMLRSSLPWQNALVESGVDGRKRPEALDWQEWNRLFAAVRAQN